VGAGVILTPIQAPNANAVAGRWVGTVRQACLDHLLVAGRRQLVRVLHLYVEHDDRHRPHRGLGLSAPEPSERCQQLDAPAAARQLHRRDVLGGLIHEHDRAA
jgi:putative transposase